MCGVKIYTHTAALSLNVGSLARAARARARVNEVLPAPFRARIKWGFSTSSSNPARGSILPFTYIKNEIQNMKCVRNAPL